MGLWGVADVRRGNEYELKVRAPVKEAKAWLERLAEAEQERRGCLRLAAKGP